MTRILPGRKKTCHPKGKSIALIPLDRQYKYGKLFDGELHTCATCGSGHAFAHSVRICQNEPRAPVCIDCRLTVGKPEKTDYSRRERLRRLLCIETRSAA